MTQAPAQQSGDVRFVGRIGFVVVIIAVVALGVHPPGSTDLYDDGQRFLEHIGFLWVAIHLVAALALMVLPLVIDVWARNLANPRAVLLGRWATLLAVIGVALGALHLLATDTMTFLAFSDTYAAGSDTSAANVGADILLRIHAATLLAWVLTFYFAFPAVAGMAARADGRYPSWFGMSAWVGAALAMAASVVTLTERQWTTLSEMVLFRISATVVVIWLLWLTWWMRQGSVASQV